jgi:hypothetical protein
VASKWLELLKELFPKTSRVSLPFNPKTALQSAYYLKLLEAAAPSLALELKGVPVSTAGEIEAEITQLAEFEEGGHRNAASRRESRYPGGRPYARRERR